MWRDNHSEGRIIMKHAKRRQRLRGTCKWGGVTLCVLLFALWLVSGWWDIGIGYEELGMPPSVSMVSAWHETRFRLDVRAGTFISVWDSTPDTPVDFEWTLWCEQFFEWQADSSRPLWKWSVELNNSWAAYYVVIPLWLPFLFIALPTGFLFWSDHRKRTRVGHCTTCGYDLKGNTTGRCPECGATTVARAASS